uniref:Protein BCCIP homolog n=1 Tax=Glossina brevipalpis TaxID=37001 RepID=A0A1A9WUN9_9MUSC
MSKNINNLNEMEEDPVDNSKKSSRNSESDQPQALAYTGNHEVRTDFKPRVILDRDWYAICHLLQRLFMKAHINCMQMADLIIMQNFLGSVIYQCESDGIESDIDDDIYEGGIIYGVITVLNITAKKDMPCVQQLRSFIIESAEKYASDDIIKKFVDILDDTSRPIAYLINERLIHVPAEFSIGLLENLQIETDVAKKNGMKFDFAYYLTIIKLYRREARDGKPKEDFYSSAEEEFLARKAINSIEYSMPDDSDKGISGDWLEVEDAPPPYRKMLLFEASQMSNIIMELRQQIQENK